MSEVGLKQKKSQSTPSSGHKKITIPRRTPSVVVEGRKVVYITPDKTTCAECTCYPKEDPYVRDKKINPCQFSPKTLYELAAKVVDGLKYPEAFQWSVEDVGNWISEDLGLPQYKACFSDNYIDGMRLIVFEDPSKLPELNIHCFEHIKMITSKVRELYSTEYIKFSRSIGLPPRKPLTHTTWFKSKSGPSWGIRRNWTRCDILRWMEILMPEPPKLDHWDLVWYEKPEFPKVMFARIKTQEDRLHLPRYKIVKEMCPEYTVPRRFKFQQGISDSDQAIWTERPLYKKKEENKRAEKKRTIKFAVPEESRLYPKKVSTEGLNGKQLILARRKMAKPKFLA